MQVPKEIVNKIIDESKPRLIINCTREEEDLIIDMSILPYVGTKFIFSKRNYNIDRGIMGFLDVIDLIENRSFDDVSYEYGGRYLVYNFKIVDKIFSINTYHYNMYADISYFKIDLTKCSSAELESLITMLKLIYKLLKNA